MNRDKTIKEGIVYLDIWLLLIAFSRIVSGDFSLIEIIPLMTVFFLLMTLLAFRQELEMSFTYQLIVAAAYLFLLGLICYLQKDNIAMMIATYHSEEYVVYFDLANSGIIKLEFLLTLTAGLIMPFLIWSVFKAKMLYLALMIILCGFLATTGQDYWLYSLIMGLALFNLIGHENKRSLLIVIFVFMLGAMIFIYSQSKVTYNILDRIDRNVLSKIEDPENCPHLLRHTLGLCSCTDRGLFDTLFKQSAYSDDNKKLTLGLGDGSIMNRSIEEGRHILLYTVKSDVRFSYLKAFSGSIYSPGQYRFHTYNETVDRIVAKASLSDGRRIEDVYGFGENDKTYPITINKRANGENYVLVPYVPYYVDGQRLVCDSYYPFDGSQITYELAPEAKTDSELLRSYKTEIVDNVYYRIDDNLKKQLQSFLQNHGIDPNSLDKAALIEKIVSLLRSDYTYSRQLPLAEDSNPIINFLLYTKTGYCVHFAGSATLLFRACDIPSRYVSGYLVEEWIGNQANIYDDDAHAWVEIYDSEKGWVSLEVTAGIDANDPTDITLPNPSEEPGGAEPSDPSDEPDVPLSPIDGPTPSPDQPSTNDDDIIVDDTFLNGLINVMIAFLTGIFILFAALLITLCYRRYYQKLPKKMIMIYDLLERYQAVDEETLMIMEKMRFSCHPVSREDYRVLLKKRKELIEKKLRSQSFARKFILWLRFDVWAF